MTIKYVLNPTFNEEQIKLFDKNTKMSRAYDDTVYLPGIVGLNNIKANDYANSVLQALINVPAIRNYFLREENYAKIKVAPGDIMIGLVKRFGELVRKLWNPRNFKAHVSPHEMLQAVVKCSKKRFQISQQSNFLIFIKIQELFNCIRSILFQGDPIEFLSWILNSLHLTLNGTKNTNSSIIYKTFQGQMKIYSKKIASIDGVLIFSLFLKKGFFSKLFVHIVYFIYLKDETTKTTESDEYQGRHLTSIDFDSLNKKIQSSKDFRLNRTYGRKAILIFVG